MKRLGFAFFAFWIWAACSSTCSGFALIGPYAPWMDTTKAYRMPGDLGGPMNIGEEYRWNVPVLTYGFDQSFINYFGYQGTQAVDQAFQMLNSLPAASQIVVTNYRFSSGRFNFTAQMLGLRDLKSFALSTIVRELGLAAPYRWMFCLRDRLVTANATNYIVIQRNFDPQTLQPSMDLDGAAYTYFIVETSNPTWADAYERNIDPLKNATSVADGQIINGEYFTALTYDDMGGLRFLLRSDNTHVEGLIDGVSGLGGSTNIVATALRPGVEKISFLKLAVDRQSGVFTPLTNAFTDRYISNNLVREQTLQRIATSPDILFTAVDPSSAFLAMSDTSRWVNNCPLNGNPSADGPGVIVPQVTIAFGMTNFWASFDGSTNYPTIYNGNPIFPPVLNSVTFSTNGLIQMSFETGTKQTNTLQYSTDLTNWIALSTWTNVSGNISFSDAVSTNAGPGFYRVISE